MRKSIPITVFVALILFVGSAQLWSVVSAQYGGDDTAATASSSSGGVKKKGNGFVGTLKSPFRAIGRIFGGGRKEAKVRRMTDKEAEKFESAGLTRVDDARSPIAASLPPSITTTDSKNAAKEVFEQGRTMLERGQLSNAIALLSRAVSLDSSLSEAQNLLGVAFDRKGLPTSAIESYRRALRSVPKNPDVLNNLGYSLYRTGDYGGAVKQLKAAAKLAPGNERILNNLALAQCRQGDLDDALTSFTRAGGEFNGHLNLAAMLELMDRNADALKQYEAARRLKPNSLVVLQHLATLYQRAGRSAEAEAARHEMAAFVAQAQGVGRGN